MKVKILSLPNSEGSGAFAGMATAHGMNVSDGLTHIDAGGSHEANPNDGVQMGADENGTPNLVEEGEVVYDDYVFSDRLKVPAQTVEKGKRPTRAQKLLKRYEGKSFAYVAKKLEKLCGVDENPTDNMAQNTFKADLELLAEVQEEIRQKEQMMELQEQLAQMSPEEREALLQQIMQQAQAEQQPQQPQQPQMTEEEFNQLSPEQQQAYMQQMQGAPQEGQMSPEEAQMMQQQQMQQPQMSPEEQAYQQQMMQQQMPPQQMGGQPMMEQPQYANGGYLYADGGDVNPMVSSPTELQQNVDETVDTAQQNIEQPAEAIDESQQAVEQAAPQEEQPERKSAEEMSTKELNAALDEIIQYAKDSGDKQLLREAKKLKKKGSRDDKEEFVDEMLEEIDDERMRQEQIDAQNAQPSPEEQAAATPEEVQSMQPEEMIAAQQMQANPSAEASAQQELAAQGNAEIPQEEQYANGGYLGSGENMYPTGGAYDIDRYSLYGNDAYKHVLDRWGISYDDILSYLSDNWQKYANNGAFEGATVQDSILNRFKNEAKGNSAFNTKYKQVLDDLIKSRTNDTAKYRTKKEKQLSRQLKKAGFTADQIDELTSGKNPYMSALYGRMLDDAYDTTNNDVTADTLTSYLLGKDRYKNPSLDYDALKNKSFYDYMINHGGEEVKQTDGKLDVDSLYNILSKENNGLTWNNEKGQFELDGKAINKEDLVTSGLYGFDTKYAKNPSWESLDKIKLHGWRLDENNKLVASDREEDYSPDADSKKNGNANDRYPISALKYVNNTDPLLFNTGKNADNTVYERALKDLEQNNEAYSAHTKQVFDAINAANGDVNKLPNWVKNYLQYLDQNTRNGANTAEDVFTYKKDKDGNLEVVGFNDRIKGSDGNPITAAQAYQNRRNDQRYGIYHYDWNDEPANYSVRRFYVGDEKNGYKQVFLPDKLKDIDFTKYARVKDSSVKGNDGNLTYDNILLGEDLQRFLTVSPDGKTVFNVDALDDEAKAALGLKESAISPYENAYQPGVNMKNKWLTSGVNGDKTGMEGVDFPLPSKTPWLIGMGLQGASLLHNLVTPTDYSNADMIANAAKSASNWMPIGAKPLGDYLTYRPLDRNYEGNKVQAQMAAERRSLENLSGGNRGTRAANILMSDYNMIGQLGDADRKAAEENRAQEQQVATFNKDTNKYNSQAFLEADKANQNAFMQAQQAGLSGISAAAQMRESIAQNKANAISSGVNGLANTIYNYGQQNYAAQQAKARWATQPRGNVFAQIGDNLFELDGKKYSKDSNGYYRPVANGGKINRKKRKSLL